MLRAHSRCLALVAFLAVPLLTAAVGMSARQASAQEASTAAAQSFSKEQLDQMLAPIALYPDDLLSNVLVAATYPTEVVQAARWLEEPANAELKGEALTRALEDKDWDPSVKALTQFPDVLAMMNEQLDWTERLGDAFLASQSDVMDRIQFLRDRAEEAGNLASNEHQTVTRRRSGDSDYIYIEPAEPDVVYVPTYEPAVYGDWWYPDYPPYYWPGDYNYVDDYYWGAGVPVFRPLWGWARPRWHDHYIHVDVRRYNRFSRHRKITSSRWRWRHEARRHDPKFRSHQVRRRQVQQLLRRQGKGPSGISAPAKGFGAGKPHAVKRSNGSMGSKTRRPSAAWKQQHRPGKAKAHRGGAINKPKLSGGGGGAKAKVRGGGQKPRAKVGSGGGGVRKFHPGGGGKAKAHQGGGGSKKFQRSRGAGNKAHGGGMGNGGGKGKGGGGKTKAKQP